MKEEIEPEYGDMLNKSSADRFRIDLIIVLREIRDKLDKQNTLSKIYMDEERSLDL